MDVARKVFNVRSCKRVLPRDIGKSRPCLYYYINQCSAPCDNKISQQEYKAVFDDIIALLEGKQADIIERLSKEMQKASDNLEFERAASCVTKYCVKRIAERQKVVSTTQGNQDVIALAKEENIVCIQIFFVRDGKMVGRENYVIKNNDQSSDSELISIL